QPFAPCRRCFCLSRHAAPGGKIFRQYRCQACQPPWRGGRAMIAHLRGQLVATGIDHAVIDVNGVGYLVGASARTLAALGIAGDTVTIHTEMLVSEDSIRLMGFATADERDWFRLLTHVQGVGSKVALAILSTLAPAELQTAIARADAAMIA